jgi:uncharacterized protein (DUF302 family)
MAYIRESRKSVDAVFAAIADAAKAEGFGVLHHYDFQATLREKGFPIANACRVIEVCNPRQASELLSLDMALCMALPCRVAIYADGDRTMVGMIPPTAMLRLVSDDPRFAAGAADVENAMQRIIDAVA